VPSDANQEWVLDFAHDAMASGRTLRVLNVVDAFRRDWLGLQADTSFAKRAGNLHVAVDHHTATETAGDSSRYGRANQSVFSAWYVEK